MMKKEKLAWYFAVAAFLFLLAIHLAYGRIR
jgi:hypothetical protein